MRPCLLYLGTEDGLITLRLEPGGRLVEVARGLGGHAARDIAVRPDDPGHLYVACGLRGWGLHRSRDSGRTWETLGFTDRWVWGVALAPDDPDTLWVGTEPPAVFASRDGGATFTELEALQHLPSRARWTFFHPPFYAGHIHGFAFAGSGEAVYAGVEHGALAWTADGGRSWHEALVGADVHRVAVDPAAGGRVMAATGSGLYVSEDGGRSWSPVPGLRGLYLHGILWCPARAGRVYAYADRHGSPLYASDDRGVSWHPLPGRLPAGGPADALAVVPASDGALIYAGDEGRGRSRLFLSRDGGETWQALDAELPKVWRLRAAPA